jgi:quercetin dioxygenase-like cupin family protein
MSLYAVKSIEDLATIHHGAVRLAAAELGIESFGLQVLDLPAGFEYPAHDHSADGQEEVYVLLRGAADFEIDGEHLHAVAGQMVRVAPTAVRDVTPGPDGVRILAIGCCVDQRYERPQGFRLEAVGG